MAPRHLSTGGPGLATLHGLALLPNLFHHRWANRALVDALSTLPPEHLPRRTPGGFGALQETLYHLILNEARYRDTSTAVIPQHTRCRPSRTRPLDLCCCRRTLTTATPSR